MKFTARSKPALLTVAALGAFTLLMYRTAVAQQSPPVGWTAEQDHRNMMEQLGIKALRPGPSGNEKDPNHANYDETKANSFGDLPDPLTLNNGQKVTSPDQWRSQRRPEIVEAFEHEVLGRIPPNVPKVTWTLKSTANAKTGVFPVIEKQLVGHVDNSAYPSIPVDIQMTLVTPGNAKGPVPVMIMFSSAAMLQFIASHPEFKKMMGIDPPSTEQLIAGGWGYALLDTSSIQADNGAGLTKGIIGLTNKGQPRKPEDWGALRAWGWGASRGLDYLETDKNVDAKRVGIEGVSRYGKAALVTMAFDTRFAVVLVGSSGEGGAKPHRRNFGEAVESLTGSGEYHWMAGNFLKYGAAESSFGSKNAADLPVDANELIALCAPRLTFISYGVPEKGDANWLDQRGSFMATVSAGAVFRLLGAKDLGVTEDYRSAKMPPVNTGLLDGRLAWRQHDGGHTDAPNWKYFIPWADKFFNYTPAHWELPAAEPVFRTDAKSLEAHANLLAKAKQGGVDVYFEGDSITRRWGALDYPDLLANWNRNFSGWNAADFGWGADRTQNILWRLENGELDGVNPKVVVLLAGTNNLGDPSPNTDAKVADITQGVEAIVKTIQAKAPAATIVLMGIFPRNDNMAFLPVIEKINANLSKFSDGVKVRYLDIGEKIAAPDGSSLEGMLNPTDKLHLTVKAYQVWADALKPLLTELIERPAKSAILIDTHNDVTSDTVAGLDIGKAREDGHTDIPRMRLGGMSAQFFAVYVDAGYVEGNRSAHRTLEMIDTVRHDIVENHADEFVFAVSADDIERAHRQGKIAALMGIEGGHAIEDSLRLLRDYYALGVRYMTLTHVNSNHWADSSGDTAKPNNGLSDFGKSVVLEMNRLGMMVDISHVADKTFWDALAVSRAPIFASHSSCRALTNVPRNMTDEMLVAMANKGGVIQINFNCGFLSQKSADADAASGPGTLKRFAELESTYKDDPHALLDARRKLNAELAKSAVRATLDDVVAHIDHAVKIAGVDHVGLGSDFDGVECTPIGLDDASKWPNLTRALLAKGYNESDIRKIYGENTLRLMRAVEQTAAAMRREPM